MSRDPDARDAVAKIRIEVVGGAEREVLLSRKRSDDPRSHGRLELPGGHVDPGESPREAMIRELREEETTGRLAALAEAEPLPVVTRRVDVALHHLFRLEIDPVVAAALRADPGESQGFVRVPARELDARALDEQLTFRTRGILDALEDAGEDAAAGGDDTA